MEDFEQLYHLYSKQLYKYLLYMSGDKHVAEELLQETYYQAIKSIFRFKGDSKVSTWLYQIAKNLFYKHLSSIHKAHLVPLDEAMELTSSVTPEEILEKAESSKELKQGIHQLKEPYKEIVVLRSYSELSFREIGEIFRQSEGWARTNFYRAKLQLKDSLLEKSEEV